MATYKHFKVGNVVKAESNYGFDGVVQKWPVLGNTDNTDPAARYGRF